MKILMLIPLLFLFGCSFCIDGSGEVVTKDDFTLTYFDSVELSGSGEMYIEQGDRGGLRIVAEDNVINNMKFEIRDQKLTIGQKTCIRNTEPVKIYVTMGDVKSVALSGSGNITSEGVLDSPDLTVEVSGSGDVDLDLDVQKLVTVVSGTSDVVYSGSADRHTYKLTGSGSLEALEMSTAITSVDVSGSGNASVWAKQELNVDVSGSCDVSYKGDAFVTSEISGSGKVEAIK